jgi:hypothetical protein
MVADQFEIVAGFGRYRIIGDQHFFFQRRIIAVGNNFQRQKVDQFSPVEVLVIHKPVIGVFLSIDLVLQVLDGPKIGELSF